MIKIGHLLRMVKAFDVIRKRPLKLPSNLGDSGHIVVLRLSRVEHHRALIKHVQEAQDVRTGCWA